MIKGICKWTNKKTVGSISLKNEIVPKNLQAFKEICAKNQERY